MIPFKSIRVGSYDVKVTPLTVEETEKCLGIFHKNEMRMGLADKYATKQMEAQIVLHELLHAIYEVMGIHAKDGEERIVAQVSQGLAQVIRDNPKLIEWLRKQLS